ncbi:MAG: GntR family transcriptional regulator, partial [Clostridiales bacterium]|nr:GntR family transcriptional regulator [Clostridiales bacterium]
ANLLDTVETIVQTRYSFVAEDDPLPNYTLRIPDGSWLVGKSIGSLKFWQFTGSTIIAIRRGQNVILSPGPYAELFNGDTIVFVGTPAAADAANRFVREEGGTA